MDISYGWKTAKQFGIALLFAGAARYYLDLGCHVVASLRTPKTENIGSSTLESLLLAMPNYSQSELLPVPASPYSDSPTNFSDTRQYPFVPAHPNHGGAL